MHVLVFEYSSVNVALEMYLKSACLYPNSVNSICLPALLPNKLSISLLAYYQLRWVPTNILSIYISLLALENGPILNLINTPVDDSQGDRLLKVSFLMVSYALL